MKTLKQLKFSSEASIFCRSHNMTGLLSPNICFKTSEVPPRKVSHYHHICFHLQLSLSSQTWNSEILLQGEGYIVWLALKWDTYKACLDCEGHPILKNSCCLFRNTLFSIDHAVNSDFSQKTKMPRFLLTWRNNVCFKWSLCFQGKSLLEAWNFKILGINSIITFAFSVHFI